MTLTNAETVAVLEKVTGQALDHGDLLDLEAQLNVLLAFRWAMPEGTPEYDRLGTLVGRVTDRQEELSGTDQ